MPRTTTMVKLTDLPGWKTLNKKEQRRLKEVHGDKSKATGQLISKRELDRADKEAKKDG